MELALESTQDLALTYNKMAYLSTHLCILSSSGINQYKAPLRRGFLRTGEQGVSEDLLGSEIF